jgi:hypothetical protein
MGSYKAPPKSHGPLNAAKYVALNGAARQGQRIIPNWSGVHDRNLVPDYDEKKYSDLSDVLRTLLTIDPITSPSDSGFQVVSDQALNQCHVPTSLWGKLRLSGTLKGLYSPTRSTRDYKVISGLTCRDFIK